MKLSSKLHWKLDLKPFGEPGLANLHINSILAFMLRQAAAQKPYSNRGIHILYPCLTMVASQPARFFGSKSSDRPFTLSTLPKSSVFSNELPPDSTFPTPKDSHAASRETLGPRLVRGALYTFIRPQAVNEAKLLGISQTAMKDLGLAEGSELDDDFKETLCGNRIITWNEDRQDGIYPWAQCYGGK